MAPAVAAPGTAGDVLLEDDAASKERRFLKWLQDNGACMDALEWPRDTPSGSRGVLTTRHVQSGESLLVIPEKLMMTPPQALQLGGGVGEAFAAHPRLMRGDNILAVYFMHECLRGKDSFYYPYLSTISEPSGLDQWPMEALSALQDGGKLMERYQMRRRQTRSLWERTFASLAETHPETFPPEDYTFELFYRAWQIVRARAFGRRLPWSALVPGADLLNHGNVQTKYELRDGLFRLFPSGANSYQAHSEALNSYGRRPNDNLLLDYGFCLLDNSWDEVEISFQELVQIDALRVQLLRGILGGRRVVCLRRDVWSTQLIEIFSVCTATDEEVHARLTGELETSFGSLSLGYFDNVAGIANQEQISKDREATTIRAAIQGVTRFLDSFETTALEDEAALASLESSSQIELLFAIRYRLTAKRVLLWHVKSLEDHLEERLLK